MNLLGLHHVTAVTGRAAENVRFYTQVLGMRLVKKTVNQDDITAYHLLYGDALGRPGSQLTFIDWPDAEPATTGAGMVASIGLRVSGARSLEAWAERLEEFGIAHTDLLQWGGNTVLGFSDPEGLRLELVDDGGAPGGTPWAQGPISVDIALRGLHSVTLAVQDLDLTARMLVDVLEFRRIAEVPLPADPARQTVVYETGPGGPGARVHVEANPAAKPGRVGVGRVHHVAFRAPDESELRQWQARIGRALVGVTPILDRFYFRSVYFHEPGGVLMEIATDGPGVTLDENPEHLGESLCVPPFLEPYRPMIDARLKPLTGG